jgi:hypothetical protein
MNLVHGGAESILLVAASLVAGMLMAIGYQFFWHGRKIRAVWQLGAFSQAPQIVVATLDPQPANERARPATGMAELLAVSFVRQSLIQAYPKSREPTVIFSSRLPPTSYAHTLISVGGGKHNRVTRIIAGRYVFPYEVLSSPTRIRERGTGRIFTPELMEGELRRDYGLITRIPNPLREQSTIFLLRGAHPDGVSAAGMMLTPDRADELVRAIKTLGPYWQVLIEVVGPPEDGQPRIIGGQRVEVSSKA